MMVWQILNLVSGLPLVMTFVNLLTWQRGRRFEPTPYRVSVLVPARNEADNIERCVEAVFASDYPVFELIVYDDQSSDGTAEILERLRGTHPELRVLAGRPLPEGWVGKPHACHHLSRAAHGEVLLFVDADTILEPGGIRRMLSLLDPGNGRSADLVSAVPRQLMESGFERLMMPLLTLTYTAWFPLRLVDLSRDRRFMAANGQLLMIRREGYRAMGGFAAVGGEIVDDMAFCRLAKKRGARVVFADGFQMARCRMYQSREALWQGFTKNLYEGLGNSPVSLFVVLAIYLLAFIWPYLALLTAAAMPAPALLLPAAVGVFANLLTRGMLAVRFGHSAASVLLHPVAVGILMLIALNSFRQSLRGRLQWRGRVYPGRRKRLETV